MFVHCQAVYIIKMMLLCAANQTFSNRSATTAGRTAFDDLPDPRRRECPHRFDELLQLLFQPFPPSGLARRLLKRRYASAFDPGVAYVGRLGRYRCGSQTEVGVPIRRAAGTRARAGGGARHPLAAPAAA